MCALLPETPSFTKRIDKRAYSEGSRKEGRNLKKPLTAEEDQLGNPVCASPVVGTSCTVVNDGAFGGYGFRSRPLARRIRFRLVGMDLPNMCRACCSLSTQFSPNCLAALPKRGGILPWRKVTKLTQYLFGIVLAARLGFGLEFSRSQKTYRVVQPISVRGFIRGFSPARRIVDEFCGVENLAQAAAVSA